MHVPDVDEREMQAMETQMNGGEVTHLRHHGPLRPSYSACCARRVSLQGARAPAVVINTPR